jgi:2-dehydropantoate 2-reductase
LAPPLDICVIGAGNMGCVYGGNLARIGQRVAFLDVSKEHVARIQSAGLHLEGWTGDFTVHAAASLDPAELPKADLALILVNAYNTRTAAHSARKILKPDGYAITLQNGVGNIEILTEVLGPDRVLAGLSFHSGDLAGPGHVRHTNNGPTYLGEIDRTRTPRLATLAALFEQASLNPVLVEDITATIWSKFVHNCGINALCALTNLRPGHIREVPELHEFQRALIAEAVALVEAKGIRLPDADPIAVIQEYCAHKFHRPSMMQHLDRNQPTEIDALNGYVATESHRLGLPAPANDALTRLIKGRQHHPSR